ncbi:MAG TPA: S8 family serine peptidase, partial [Methylibium sp.]|nr:S8 family serine peptidase [Methylibium sp.]
MFKLTRRLAITVGLLAAVPAAQAQLGLPVRPALPGVGLPGDLTRPLRLPEAPLAELAGRRLRQVDELLRRHAGELEPDPAGQPVVRGELLLVAPGDALLAEARRRGYALLRERRVEGLDERWVVLRPPPGVSLAEARAALLAVDPQATIDFNHLYLPAGEPSSGSAAPAMAAPPRGAARIGLVDSGVEASHPALRGLALQRQGCGGALHPQAHGTAVASLLVGRAEGFGGAAAGATLYAADVYCGVPTGGAVDAVAEALAWMARERVAVVNLSLVGPPNRLLERLVAALVARGHLLVAAVGNDGPAAPPLYPAAYPGVVGVTAVT